ncbi:hypothetical protein HGA91_00285 [candidate division WWE3 bacterium]|nr:hypothetical protein [candidate division WWE3 bacterium]
MATVTFFPCAHTIEDDTQEANVVRHNGFCPICRADVVEAAKNPRSFGPIWFADDQPEKHHVLFLGEVTFYDASKGFGFIKGLGIDGNSAVGRSYYFHGSDVWNVRFSEGFTPIEFYRNGHDWVQPTLKKGELVCFRVRPERTHPGKAERVGSVARAADYRSAYLDLLAAGDPWRVSQECHSIAGTLDWAAVRDNHWVELMAFD